MAPHQELLQRWEKFYADRLAIISCLPMERGVCQGSVLSPTHFNILGLCVNNLYGGAYLHADDIRTVATAMSILQPQISQVLKFVSTSVCILICHSVR